MTVKLFRRCIAGLSLCLTVAAPAGSQAASPAPRQTIDALRFRYTDAQLNHIYRSLTVGPMPEGPSRGFVRFDLGFGSPLSYDRRLNTMLNDPITPYFWKGQVWFINSEGEQELTNRVGNDHGRAFPAYVTYGKSLLDGRTAMIGAYPGDENPPPINNIVLDCRAAQSDPKTEKPKVLFCYAWLYLIKPFFGPKRLLFYVFQDFTNPN